MGCVTPIGLDVASTWHALLKGVSGVKPIRAWDTTGYDVRIGGEIPEFDPTRIMSAKESRRVDRFIQLGLYAAREAWRDAGIDLCDEQAERAGAIAGSGIGGIGSL